nr:E3 ubiquitin-protein ligase PPP1R11 [Chelonoidis abingdonii]
MAEATATATAAAGGRAAGATVTETVTIEPENRSLTIKLRKRKPDKKVEWSSDTVDNEHLGRRSSKCWLHLREAYASARAPLRARDETRAAQWHCHPGPQEWSHGAEGVVALARQGQPRKLTAWQTTLMPCSTEPPHSADDPGLGVCICPWESLGLECCRPSVRTAPSPRESTKRRPAASLVLLH